MFKVHLQLNFEQTGVFVTSVVTEAGTAGALVEVGVLTRASRLNASMSYLSSRYRKCCGTNSYHSRMCTKLRAAHLDSYPTMKSRYLMIGASGFIAQGRL